MAQLIPYLIYFGLINLGLVLVGYLLIQKQMIWQSWLLLIVGVAGINFIFIHQQPIIRMLAIIAITFTGMKVIAVAQSYQGKTLSLSFKQWFTFATGWAGMRAQPFETLGGPAIANARPMIWFGISRVVGGLVLIALARLTVHLNINNQITYILVSTLLLVGFSLILHFGLLSISAGMWRLKGVNTYYLFRQPVLARSLTEFWSKRWNIAFSEMTSVAIFRPLKNKIGSAGALMLAFAFSGLLHELALSVPVNSGYGFPLFYFMLQGSLVLLEKALSLRKVKFLQNPITARLWVFFWLVLPIPLLFHTAFIKHIVWPLAGLAGLA